MKTISNILMLSCIISCSTFKEKEYKSVIYASEFQTTSLEKPFKKKKFKIILPKGFIIDKEDFNPEYKEIRYIYNDSIIVYITDNIFGGSALNGNNKLNQGISSIKRNSLTDSIYMYGQQINEKYWKEALLNDVVIGYLNVPKTRKDEFDKAIKSLELLK